MRLLCSYAVNSESNFRLLHPVQAVWVRRIKLSRPRAFPARVMRLSCASSAQLSVFFPANRLLLQYTVFSSECKIATVG